MWFALYACGLIIPERDGQQWTYTRERFSFASLSVQDAADGVPMRSGVAWFGFVFSTAVHAGAFFSLLGSVGTVSSGIVKGMTTSTYVLLSGWAFCGVDGSYCLTWRTLTSGAVCAVSVICYSLATKRAKSQAVTPATQMVADTAPGSELTKGDAAKPTAKEESLRQRKREGPDAAFIAG